jgi:MOSC domain-containing protein
MHIGTIQTLWRYPVKSMLGEKLDTVSVGLLGFPGDRGYAIRDEKAGEIRGAKKIPDLLQCSARYLEPPSETRIPTAEMTLPDRTTVRTDAADANVRLTQALGRPVTLWPRRPAEDTDHYRRKERDPNEIREILGLEEGDPFPSFEGIPEELFQYVSPLGTYFDAYPLHILTTASLRSLAKHYPEGQFAPERFRPNIVIASTGAGDEREEESWKGKAIRIGEVELQVIVPTIRCVMTTLPQGNLPKDPRILRTLVHHHSQHLGVYVTVKRTGAIRVGDGVEVG